MLDFAHRQGQLALRAANRRQNVGERLAFVHAQARLARLLRWGEYETGSARVKLWHPPGGPGVRTDSAIYTGYAVPPYYDSMLAKVIVWALTWEDAVARSRR